jgi:hypothetical protein
MLYQPFSITKCFSRFHQAARQRILSKYGQRLLISGLAIGLSASPALALVKMEPKSIEAALVYGMRNQKLGLAGILGPNWIEGENGALLNIYSPFMNIATKASKANFSSNPARSDLDKAKKRFAREVAYYSDAKNRLEVKFAVSMYGDSPGFAKTYLAKIVGFGRGKEFEIKPVKLKLDDIADSVPGGVAGASYEAVNGYYFNFSDLENLDEFTLLLESPTAPPIQFRMRNAKIY